MIFAPHILQLRTEAEPTYDEYGRIVPGSDYGWTTLGDCRCDDNTTQEFTSNNGTVFRPNFHVVCKFANTLQAGDYIRCLKGDDCRGQGEVTMVKHSNYFGYTELWM